MAEDKNSDLPPNPAYAQDPYFGCPEKRPLNLGRYAAPAIIQCPEPKYGYLAPQPYDWFYACGGGQ